MSKHASSIAAELRASSAAIRVSFTWFGTTKALDKDQTADVAAAFDADAGSLRASKKLIDTKHPAYRRLTRLKSQIGELWQEATLPFPEKGVRLIRRDRLPELVAQLETFRDALASAAADLDAQHYEEMREQARERLGRLFNWADYPPSIAGSFAVAWDFPNVEPPAYLAKLAPAQYEAETRRVAQQFDAAVKLAEEAFAEEFTKLITHLCERITRDETTGEQKVFHASNVDNLKDFFERFRSLNLHSNGELDSLINQAQEVIGDRGAKDIKTNATARSQIQAGLSDVAEALQKLTGKAPRRRIDRAARPAAVLDQADAQEEPAELSSVA